MKEGNKLPDIFQIGYYGWVLLCFAWLGVWFGFFCLFLFGLEFCLVLFSFLFCLFPFQVLLI